MNIRETRDKIISFLFPVILVAVILWTIVWTVGKTYFWDVSSLKLQLDAPSQVTIRLQAELIDTNIHILGFDYRIHFTLPWSREESCTAVCDIARLPPGSGSILVSNTENNQSFFISIARNTAGTVDFRTPIRVNFLSNGDVSSISAQWLTEEEKKALGDISFENRVDGIYVVARGWRDVFYDSITRQIFTPPIDVQRVYRGTKEGKYLLVTWKDITLWDRYGRESMTKMTNTDQDVLHLAWNANSTTFTYKNNTQTLSGKWFPRVGIQNRKLFSDGQRIIEIQLLDK